MFSKPADIAFDEVWYACAEGLPTLMLSNMPVQSTVPELNVTRSEITFDACSSCRLRKSARLQQSFRDFRQMIGPNSSNQILGPYRPFQ